MTHITLQQKIVALLKDHGLEVETLVFEPKARALDGAPLFRYTIDVKEMGYKLVEK